MHPLLLATPQGAVRAKWLPMLGSGLPPDGDVASHRIGDLGCDSVSIDDFERQNRVPLVREGWNVWILNRTLRDNPSVGELEVMAENFLDRWFRSGPYASAWHSPGGIDNVTITSLWGTTKNSYDQYLDPPKKAKVLEDAIALRTRSGIPSAVFLRPGPSTQVAVRFVYRGTLPDLPWPVWKAQMINPRCPMEADWALEAAYKFAHPPPVPKEEAPLGGIPDALNPRKILDKYKWEIGTGAAIALTIGGAVLAAYVARSFK
jgi:hypothetical protein